MLKQDRARLMERHASRTNAMQPSMSERVENKPVHQVEEQPQVEENQCASSGRTTSGRKPMQQVVVEPQVEENQCRSSGRASTKANFKYGSRRESICCKSKRE